MAALSHRLGWSWIPVVLLIPNVFFAISADHAPLATYRTNAAEVRVSFFGTDEHNRPLETLHEQDFAVVDDGVVVRDFRSLTHASETALDVVFLVDASESVGRQLPALVKEVAQLIADEPAGENVQSSIISFHGLQPDLLCAGDCLSALAGTRLLPVRAGGATPLFDSLVYAARFLARRETTGMRQVVILFSDGNDTISKSTARDAMETVTASGALLYTVDLNHLGENPRASAALERMAEATGGRALVVDNSASLLQAVLADLRASYIVTYQLPRREAGYHTLCILPQHNLNLRFHCRSGYYYERSIP